MFLRMLITFDTSSGGSQLGSSTPVFFLMNARRQRFHSVCGARSLPSSPSFHHNLKISRICALLDGFRHPSRRLEETAKRRISVRAYPS